MSNVTFGSDPEFFLSLYGIYKSAIGVVPGSIGNRYKIGDYQFYWDNVLAECAIKPGVSQKEVVDNIRECLVLYANLIKPYVLEAKASYNLHFSELLDKRSRIIGCNPDICAYTTKTIKPDAKIMKTPFRSGGGHIHLGCTEGFLREDGPERILLVYLMDLFLAVPSLFLDTDRTSPDRRKIYGHAGRYRPTSYGIEDTPEFSTGIEYRPLGNFWLKSPHYVELIYDLTMFVVNMVKNNEYNDFWEFNEDKFYTCNVRNLHKAFNSKYDLEQLKKCIVNSDKELAFSFYSLVCSKLPQELKDRLCEAVSEGITEHMYENWGIEID